MKLATLKDGSRDGKLVVVSRDLTRFTDASFLVRTLQSALDDWSRIAPHLATMAESLETGAVPSSRFHEHAAHSPLPRAYQRIEAVFSAGHAAPIMRQTFSDGFVGPRDPIVLPGDREDVAAVGEVAVIIDDLPAAATREQARLAIRLVLLASGAAFSPVAVTPDELGGDWKDGRLGLPLGIDVNGKRLDSATGSGFDFPGFIAGAAAARALTSGTIISSGAPATGTAVLRPGDTIRVVMKSGSQSIFGAIEQTVQPPT